MSKKKDVINKPMTDKIKKFKDSPEFFNLFFIILGLLGLFSFIISWLLNKLSLGSNLILGISIISFLIAKYSLHRLGLGFGFFIGSLFGIYSLSSIFSENSFNYSVLLPYLNFEINLFPMITLYICLIMFAYFSKEYNDNLNYLNSEIKKNNSEISKLENELKNEDSEYNEEDLKEEINKQKKELNDNLIEIEYDKRGYTSSIDALLLFSCITLVLNGIASIGYESLIAISKFWQEGFFVSMGFIYKVFNKADKRYYESSGNNIAYIVLLLSSFFLILSAFLWFTLFFELNVVKLLLNIFYIIFGFFLFFITFNPEKFKQKWIKN